MTLCIHAYKESVDSVKDQNPAHMIVVTVQERASTPDAFMRMLNAITCIPFPRDSSGLVSSVHLVLNPARYRVR